MSHLSTDRLAAIADDTPTADEATHLAGCWDCRAELTAYRRLVRMSAMAPLPTEPLTAWSQLAPRLRAEGLIADAVPATTVSRIDRPVSSAPRGGGDATVLPFERRRSGGMTWVMRAAAGLALLIGGVAAGRFSTRISFDGGSTSMPMAAARPVFESNDDAIRVLTAAQQQYQSAAAFLAAQDTSSRFIGMNEDSYQARLAALDEIAAATRAALYRAPQDPMLNQYYLTTIGAREATLRQIGATMPDSRRLERY
ncbi:MAG: hypothetical protein ACKVS7_01095 [Gemmatimonadaceae bacterium]